MTDAAKHPLADYLRVPMPYQQHEYAERFGLAPPPDIRVHPSGDVAFGVGPCMLTHQSVRSFVECLSYLRDDTLGVFSAPLDSKHPLARWLAVSRGRPCVDTGVGASFLVAEFNYCLYIVREHSTPPRQWLRRLRLWDQFPGAFLELRLAAAFLVRGLSVKYVSESSNASKPEFDVQLRGIETYFGVEAKFRVRTGTVSDDYPESGMKDLKRRVREGAEKKISYSFIVVVELSLPWSLDNGQIGPIDEKIFDDLFQEAVSQEWWNPHCKALVFLNSINADFLERELPSEGFPAWVTVRTVESSGNDADLHLLLCEMVKGLKQSARIPQISW